MSDSNKSSSERIVRINLDSLTDEEMTTDVESDEDFEFTDWCDYNTDNRCSEAKDNKKDEKTSHSDKHFDEDFKNDKKDIKKDFKFDPKKEMKHKSEPLFECKHQKGVNEGEKPSVKQVMNKTKEEVKYCDKKEEKNDINSEVKRFLKKCNENDIKNNELSNAKPWYEMPSTSKWQPNSEHKVRQSFATPAVRSVQMKDQSTDSRYVMRSPPKSIAPNEGIHQKTGAKATPHAITQTTAKTTTHTISQTTAQTISHTITHTITETITDPIAENTPQTTNASNCSSNVKKIWVFICVNCDKRLKTRNDFIRHHNKRHVNKPKGFIKAEKCDPKYKSASYSEKRKEKKRHKHKHKTNSLLATDSVPKIKAIFNTKDQKEVKTNSNPKRKEKSPPKSCASTSAAAQNLVNSGQTFAAKSFISYTMAPKCKVCSFTPLVNSIETIEEHIRVEHSIKDDISCYHSSVMVKITPKTTNS